MEAGQFGAVVLSGGDAVRLGGADKASLEVGGRTLLEHALAALVDAAEIVVVGTEVPTSRPVTFTREDPAGGGPAAALLAGLQALLRSPSARTTRLVVVLAVDMPLVTAASVRRLVEAAADDGADDGPDDGAVMVDDEGQVQYLCAAYSVAALEQAQRASGEGAGHGLSMRRLVDGLRLTRVAGEAGETRDLDTWEDLVALRETFEE